MMGEAKNQNINRLVKMSLISLKWTVRAETRKAIPRLKTNWTKMTRGRNNRYSVNFFPRIGTKRKMMGRPNRK